MNTIELKTYIIENNKIPDILDYIGCTNIKPHKKCYSFSTIYNTRATSTTISKNTLNVKVWADNEKGLGGDIFSFCGNLLNINFYDTFKLLHEILGLDYNGFSAITIEQIEMLNIYKRKAIENKGEIKFYTKKEIEFYYAKIPFLDWVQEGILPETQDFFEVGYSRSYNRVVFPHKYYKDGSYVGLIGRTLFDDWKEFDIPKYFPIIEYLKGENIYGLYENMEYIKKAGYVVVYEAEKSVMKRYSKLDRTAVALCCHEITETQIKILLSLKVDIVFAMDSDISLFEVRGLCNQLYGRTMNKVYYLYDKTKTLLGEKESPADAKEVIFKELWRTKVLYNGKEYKKYIKELKSKNN